MMIRGHPDADRKHGLRLLNPVAAQLGHHHGRKRDGATASRLGVLLPTSRLGLFGAGDHRELARVEIERPPAKSRYLPATHPAEDAQHDRNEHCIAARFLDGIGHAHRIEHRHLLALNPRRLHEIGGIARDGRP